MAKICSKCKNEIIGTPKFCRKCGASKEYFIEEVEEGNFCPECGNKCLPDDLFCPECGFNLSTDPQEETKEKDEWETVETDEWNNIKEDDEWNTNDSEDDNDEWKDLVNNFESIDETDKFIEFDYKKNSKGEITIVKLKDEYVMEVVVPNGVTVIGNSAFEGCNALTITLPQGIKTIGKRAFANCSNLKELIVPSSVMMIGDEAFKDSKNLFVTIPDNVSFIGENIIKGTVNELKEIEKENQKFADYQKGLKLVQEEKYGEALQYLNYGIEKGYVEAYEKLALCKEKLYGFYKSDAFDLYLKAANMGSVFASTKVAGCYMYGRIVEKNIDLAIKYYEFGVNKKDWDAISGICYLYYTIGNYKKMIYYRKMLYNKSYEEIDEENGILYFLEDTYDFMETYYKDYDGTSPADNYREMSKLISTAFDVMNRDFNIPKNNFTDAIIKLYDKICDSYEQDICTAFANCVFHFLLLIYDGKGGYKQDKDLALELMDYLAEDSDCYALNWLSEIGYYD